jgi:phosphate starvation-inducible PhoH-like protein
MLTIASRIQTATRQRNAYGPLITVQGPKLRLVPNLSALGKKHHGGNDEWDMLHGLAKSEKQSEFCEHLKDRSVDMVVGIGPAGCGKTFLSCAHAIQGLLRNEIKRIVITRPTVAADENLGFLPGNLEEKMYPWMVPVYDCFKEYLSAQRLKEYMINEQIEVCPLSFMRGRTFNNSWIIADEVQNSTVNQMRTLLTRIGKDSKIILTGDLAQCDLSTGNGMADFLKRYRLYCDDNNPSNKIRVVEFHDADVVRSDLVKTMLDVYKY